MTKNDETARAAFTVARSEREKIVQAQPNYGPALCVLALADAGLDRKEDALRGGRRAVELLPVAKDSINGAHMVEYFAMIAAGQLKCSRRGIYCEVTRASKRSPLRSPQERGNRPAL